MARDENKKWGIFSFASPGKSVTLHSSTPDDLLQGQGSLPKPAWFHTSIHFVVLPAGSIRQLGGNFSRTLPAAYDRSSAVGAGLGSWWRIVRGDLVGWYDQQRDAVPSESEYWICRNARQLRRRCGG